MSKWSEIEKNYSRCGPSFSEKPKSLKSTPLEEPETILLAWFKEAQTTKASIDGTHVKEKALHVTAHLGIDDFQASNGWIDHFQKRHNLVYKTILRESVIVNPESVMDWNSEELPKMTDGYKTKEIINVDKTGLFHNLQPSMTLTYKSNSCHGGTKSKQRVTVLLGCNADGTEKLLPLVIDKYNKPHCFRNVKKLPTKCTANSNSWTSSATCEKFLVQLRHQTGAKNRKILLFIDQCAAHP